jgi:hypothetical protein
MFTGSNIVKNALAVKLKLATLKHLYRCMEKMCFKVGENRYQAESVCDIVRCIISCDDCGHMSAVLAAIMADQKLRVVRVKVRGGGVLLRHICCTRFLLVYLPNYSLLLLLLLLLLLAPPPQLFPGPRKPRDEHELDGYHGQRHARR